MSATKKKRRLKNINILLCGSWFSFYILQLQQYFEQQWSLSFHLLCMKIRDLKQNISFCIFQSSDANLAVATTSMFCCKQLFWRNYDKPWVILKPTVGKCHFDCFSFHKFTNVVWFYICVIFLFPWAITFFFILVSPRCLLPLVLLENLGFFPSRRFPTRNLRWQLLGKWLFLLHSELLLTTQADEAVLWWRDIKCWLWNMFPT